MTREELVERIKVHEAHCGLFSSTKFEVVTVMELADGAMAVCDTEGEYTLYFDKSKLVIRLGMAIEDLGPRIRAFPADAGFITDKMARSWDEIRKTAKRGLAQLNEKRVDWYSTPVRISY